jgi:hypothetical protein
MLRVNVGLSRKLSRDYNSTGYTINLEGEVAATLDDPESVIERIREFYDLADEALRDQIERDASITALAAHDATPPAPQPASRRAPVNRIADTGHAAAAPLSPTPPATASAIEPATVKQKQFLQTLAKRLGLDDRQLEQRIAEVLGRSVRLGDLNKREAGEVLDCLTAISPTITHP